VFAQAGLPLAALGLIAAVDQPLGMMLTGVNVNGDLAGTFIVAKTEDRLDEKSPLTGGPGMPDGRASSDDDSFAVITDRTGPHAPDPSSKDRT